MIGIFNIKGESVSVINTILNVIFCIWLGLASFVDIRKKKISKKMLLMGAIIGFLLFVFNQNGEIKNKLLGLAIGLIFYLIYRISRGQIGLGDVGVLFIIGGAYGIDKSIQIILCSFLLVFICSIFLFIVKKLNRKYELPYLPFLFLGLLTLWI